MKEDEIRIEVRETCRDTSALGVRKEWCDCPAPEFLCYPEDGACSCGVEKHHVHCRCGGILQVG